LDSSVKALLTEKSHPSLKVPGKGVSPPCSPKWGPYGNICPFHNTSFRVPSKGALPSGSSQRAHTERDAPLPDTSFICLSKSLVTEPPLGFPMGPLWRVMPISKAFFLSFTVPSKGAPPPPPRNPQYRFPRERLHLKSPSSTVSQSPRFPNRAHMERDACFQSLLLHIP
jgi:hypothetical protein